MHSELSDVTIMATDVCSNSRIRTLDARGKLS